MILGTENDLWAPSSINKKEAEKKYISLLPISNMAKEDDGKGRNFQKEGPILVKTVNQKLHPEAASGLNREILPTLKAEDPSNIWSEGI